MGLLHERVQTGFRVAMLEKNEVMNGRVEGGGGRRVDEKCKQEVADDRADKRNAGQEESSGKPQLVEGDDHALLQAHCLEHADVKH